MRKCSARYVKMIDELQENNKNLKVYHGEKNESFDTFIRDSNDEVMQGVESVS